jgi:CDP-paratose 2-epimerase
VKLLITGACGFVGSALCLELQEQLSDLLITGLDNLSRRGSWRNLERLEQRGIRVIHGDIRQAADLEGLEPQDWLIDAAANPSVLAGVDGKASSRQLVEHNLMGTVQMLESCKRWGAGFVLLSTSRVYSIPSLAQLSVEPLDGAFVPTVEALASTPGLSAAGIDETFSTAAPVSLYGATKLASEVLALEYGDAFGIPVRINRCGVLAGAGQFGKADQGIFAFWLHSWREQRPLQYIGFDGQGHQVARLPPSARPSRPADAAAAGRRRSQQAAPGQCEWWCQIGLLAPTAQHLVRRALGPKPSECQPGTPAL